ncbi:GIY-YIG nuclease family protein [Comamonas sp. GB3 AK4-5]|uniref:GIY-YIG nuclease family protein n=1 Tax=Comamonas sp. GB3 AK4-5 TaxID=3231487 RepID=UPI00351F15C4
MTSSLLLSSQARRALVRDYKQSFPPLGIYAVRCEAAGLLRLGASRNVDGMLNRIRFELSTGLPRDVELRQAWVRHGAAAFRFEVLDRVKERADPDFDYEAELQTLLVLWQSELQPELQPTPSAPGGQP